MELTELENILKGYDQKMNENIRLNRAAVKVLLTAKPEKWLTKEKLRALYYVLSPFILVAIILFTNYRFQLITNFYIGLSLFIPSYIFSYIMDVKYYLLLRKIDFTAPILSIRKRVKELEKQKLKMTRIRYILMPVMVLAALLMIIPKLVFTTEFIIMLILTGAVIISSMYYHQSSIRKRYKLLNKEIEELESLE